MRKKLLIVLVVLVSPLLVLQLIGWMLPREHQASVSVEVPVAPASVFALITDVERGPDWRSDLDEVEVLSRTPLRFRELSGGDKLLFEEQGRQEPSRWGTRVADPELPFGGTWTFQIEEHQGGSQVTITEEGFVDPPIFRVLSKWIFGHDATLRSYAADLEAECGRQSQRRAQSQ